MSLAGRLEPAVWQAWTGAGAAARLTRAALVPAALGYAATMALRNRLYDGGWLAAERVPARVLSVGNLSVGGTGKTPAALWLAGALAARGRRPAIVARGYGKQRPGVVVVGEAGRPLVGPEEGGDEAVMLAHRFAGPVVTGERRAAAARLACVRFGVDTIVLDDGFQHRGLARDADLVLASGELADAWTLPAGPLREPVAALARARALLVLESGTRPPGTLAVFRAHLAPVALVRAAAGAWLAEDLSALRGAAVTAVAGVARPERFVAALTAAGAEVRRLLRFPDHHRYGPRDAAAVAAAAREGPVLTTEKDLVKLAGLPGLAGVRALRVDLEVEDGESLLDLLLRP